MELSLLSTIFDQKITTFPGSRPSHQLQTDATQGYAVSYRTLGQRAFLFMTPIGNWLWNDEIMEPLHTLAACDQTYIFDVEVTDRQIFISDVIVYKNKTLTSRDHLERLEAARKWGHLYDGSKARMNRDTKSYKSAYPAYLINDGPDRTISVKELYPFICQQYLWECRLSASVNGLLFTRLLDQYIPYKSPGIMVWTPWVVARRFGRRS